MEAFTHLPPTRLLKTLVYYAGDDPVLILLRGDHQLSESKLAGFPAGSSAPGAAEGDQKHFGASPGSLGPVGVKGMRILADGSLEGRRDLVCGANEDGFHLRHVTPGRDFSAEFHDLRVAQGGDLCTQCGSPLKVASAIEIGHIFQLGKRYSEKMGAKVLDRDGKEVTLWMGSYGIGIERILAAAIEQKHDSDGLVMPPPSLRFGWWSFP